MYSNLNNMIELFDRNTDYYINFLASYLVKK